MHKRILSHRRSDLKTSHLNTNDVDGKDSMNPGITALTTNDSFAAFVNRMHATRRAFWVKKKREKDIELVSCPEEINEHDFSDGGNSSESTDSKWLDCCLREYIERRSKYGSRLHFLLRTMSLLLPVFALLWVYWPLWEVFIDVEADSHYKVLGVAPGSKPQEIKRAYREAVKKWHPDRNPNCDSCRSQMIKIQHAHDVLLERGDQRFELANKYWEELDKLRSLVFFRIYGMAFNSAQEAYYLVRGITNPSVNFGSTEYSWLLLVVCRILTMSLFTTYEVLYVTGFGIVVLIQVFYYCVAATKFSAQELESAGMVRRSYIDLYKEALFFAAIPCIIHALQYYVKPHAMNEGDGLEYFVQMLCGLLYVFAHLYRMTPNIFDNIAMKKCSLPISYLSPPSRGVSRQNILFTEFGVLLDDLFAFTSRVPSVYRFSVILVHCVFLCELMWLPWDFPIVRKLGRKCEKIAGKGKHENGSTGKNNDAQKDEKKERHSCALSREEVLLVENIDDEVITWLDVVNTKYKKHMNATAGKYINHKQGVVSLQLTPVSNLTEIAFVAVCHDERTKVNKVDVIFRVKDEESGRLLGLQRGPWGCIPSEPGEHNNPLAIFRTYTAALGQKASFTPSELWRRQLEKSCDMKNSIWIFLFSSIVVLLLCLIAFFLVPMPEVLAKSSFSLSPFQQCLCDSRWTFLPHDHILKRDGAGALMFWGRPLCCVDIWDALKLYPIHTS